MIAYRVDHPVGSFVYLRQERRGESDFKFRAGPPKSPTRHKQHRSVSIFVGLVGQTSARVPWRNYRPKVPRIREASWSQGASGQ